MTDDELCGWLRSMLPASGFAPTENWAPWLGADRIEQLEREKAVVSDLWEQQKEIALDYLTDCNKAADRIESQAAEIERLKVQLSVEAEPSPYCPICGSCGDEGCCGSRRCLYPAALQEQSK